MLLLLAITMGDPAGIGPETVAGAWRDSAIQQLCRPLVIGHPEIMRRAARLLNLSAEVVDVATPEQAAASPNAIPCLACGSDNVLAAPVGVLDARGGQAAYEAVMLAADLALSGKIAGIVTAPLNKAALWAAG